MIYINWFIKNGVPAKYKTDHISCCITLAHWGRVTHICVSKLTTIGSDNGLSPGRCQAIILTNAGILLIGSLGTNLSEILIEILTFSFKKMHLKISYAKWWPFCLGLNVLKDNLPRYDADIVCIPAAWFLSDTNICAYAIAYFQNSF